MKGEANLTRLIERLQSIPPEQTIQDEEKKRQAHVQSVYYRINKMKAGDCLSLTLQEFSLLADIRIDDPRAPEVMKFIIQSVNSRTVNSKPVANISIDPTNKNRIIIKKLREKYAGIQKGGGLPNYLQILNGLDSQLLNNGFTSIDIIQNGCVRSYAHQALGKLQKQGIIKRVKKQGFPITYQLTETGKLKMKGE